MEPRAVAPPDFENLLAVLSCTRPRRPTLFEFFLNAPLYARVVPDPPPCAPDLEQYAREIEAYRRLGYDYAPFIVPGFHFTAGEVREEATRSLNEGAVVTDRRSFDAYAWPDPDEAAYSVLDRAATLLPPGMKFVVRGPCGVLENVVALVGYENLCYLTVDDPALVSDVFEAVGSRLVRYYERCASHPAVGAVIGNDDWGFKTQTMLPPDQLRRFVFPWHERIVEIAHAAGKPAILHSCGRVDAVMEDVIERMKYDAKHSYEDAIQPVEEVYEAYRGRIAVLGGIDMDFVCRAAPEEVYERSRNMLLAAEAHGGYALGTGNSVPEYVPDENYFAMVRAALDLRREG